jgi:hypothetical protein
VTCSARSTASSTSDTVGSSTHAASHGNDHTAVPDPDEEAADAANTWTLVIVNASPSTIPAQHNPST